jgi:hypothetical protein
VYAIQDLLCDMEERNWYHIFLGNRTHLRIKGTKRLTGDNRTARIHLRGGTSADLLFSPSLDTNTAMGQCAVNLMQAVPNVREVDLSYSKALHIDPSTGVFPRIIKQGRRHEESVHLIDRDVARILLHR